MTTNAAPFKTGDLVRVGTRHGTLSAHQHRWATPGTLFKVENCYPAGPGGSSSGFLVCAREYLAGGRQVDGYDTSWFEPVPEDSDAPFKVGDRAVITDRHSQHGLNSDFRTGTPVTVNEVTPWPGATGGYVVVITNDDGKTYEPGYFGVSIDWLDPAPVEDDEIRVGDIVQVSDRHGRLVADQWAEPGHLFTVTTVRKDVDGNPLISARDLDGGRTIRDYGTTWFDKVPAASASVSNLRRENAQLREMNELLDAARLAAEKRASDWLHRFDLMDEELDEQIEKTRAAEKARDSYAASLTYALELLEDPVKVQRVLGYQDGVS